MKFYEKKTILKLGNLSDLFSFRHKTSDKVHHAYSYQILDVYDGCFGLF